MPDLLVPALTPFEGNRVSTVKLREHCDFLLKKGIDYIFLNGSTGLGPSLSLGERLDMLHAFDDIPEKVIVQVGALNLEESLTLARESARMKVHAIATLPPYYYPRIPDEWLIRYFKTISGIYPTFLYNFPLTTGYDLTSSLVQKVLSSGANIIGIKDTVPDLNHMLQIKWNAPDDFKVYCGPDPLILPALRSGLDGAVGGSGNYVPVLLRALVDNFDGNAGLKAQKLIDSITSVAKKYGQWSANYALVDIIHNYSAGDPRPPIFPLDEAARKSMEQDAGKALPAGDSL